jgi:chromosome segregation ATPase
MPKRVKPVSEQKTDALLAKVKKKLEVLEAYIDEGLPEKEGTTDPVDFPENATQFANWKDKSIGVESFNAPNWRKQIDPMQYRAKDKEGLRAESVRLMGVLSDLKANRGKASKEMARLRAQKKKAEERVMALSSQLQMLHAENERLRGRSAQLEARLKSCNDELRRRGGSVISLVTRDSQDG